MKKQAFDMIRYDADEGKVFDWVDLEPHVVEITKEDGTVETKQEHLYAKTIFILPPDVIENYVEVEVEDGIL